MGRGLKRLSCIRDMARTGALHAARYRTIMTGARLQYSGTGYSGTGALPACPAIDAVDTRSGSCG